MTAAVLDGALILVVGARRSGTHWLHRMLAAHPDVVDIPGETYLFSRGIAPLLERFQHASPGSTTVGTIYAEQEQVLDALRRLCDDVLGPYLDGDQSGATRLLERTPEHVTCMDVVARLYPGTRFVHIIRDGREVVRSLLEQSWGPDDPVSAAEEWRDSVVAGRAQGSSLRHYVEVRYEDLLADPKAVLTSILHALDLPVGVGEVASALAEADVVANTGARGPGAGDLTARDRRAIEDVAGDLLADLGYVTPMGGRPTAPVGSSQGEAHWSSRSIHDAQLAVDRLLEILRGVRPSDDLADLLAPSAHFRIIGHGADSTFQGDGAGVEFLAAVQHDPAFAAAQRRSDVHASPGLFTVMSTFDGDGASGNDDRAVVVRLAGDGIRAVTLYRFPVTGPPR